MNIAPDSANSLISLCRKRPGFPVSLALRHHRPGHSGDLVGERDGGNIGLQAEHWGLRLDRCRGQHADQRRYESSSAGISIARKSTTEIHWPSLEPVVRRLDRAIASVLRARQAASRQPS